MRRFDVAKKLFASVLAAFFVLTGIGITSRADMGPKPSITINFNNTDRDLYVCLYGIDYDRAGGEYTPDAPQEVCDFFEKLADESVFKEYIYCIYSISPSETQINYSYFAPDKFMIVIYDPSEHSYVRSERIVREEFNAVYNVDMNSVGSDSFAPEDTAEDDVSFKIKLEAVVSPEDSDTYLNMAVRLAITLVIELVLALIFGIRGIKSFLVLLITNIATQVALNILTVGNKLEFGGGFQMLGTYLLVEAGIFAVEMIVYLLTIKKLNTKQIGRGRIAAYALIANIVSFAASFLMVTL